MTMKSRRKHFVRRRPFLIGVCFFAGVVLTFAFYAILYKDEEKISFHVVADESVTDFLIDTPGCQIPAWNPWDKSVAPFFEPVWGPYRCPGPPSFLRVLPNAVVSIDRTILRLYYEMDARNVSCTYRTVLRDDAVVNETVDGRFRLDSPRSLSFDVPLKVDFVKTECKFLGRDVAPFVEYLPLTPLKSDVEERCVNALAATTMQNPLNVLFIGIDSISNFNFLRHFRMCKKYLSKFLSPVNLKGYVKVGDNTFPNLVPLLTGYFHQHYYDDAHKNMFFDNVDFSWKAFAKYGYRTLFAEDAPSIATFNYYRNGFKRPPTDYYFRPFALAVEDSPLRQKHCMGSRMEMEILYSYLKSFVETMGTNRPFFAFLFAARLTHDVFNYAGYADEPTFQLLRHLHEAKVLDNTMLVFFSDHGLRYGPMRKTTIGQFEERMPFANVLLPKWFAEKHPDMVKNLKFNSERLTTPFDVHATVMHLASVITGDPKLESGSGPGMSLFRPVPTNRTCSKAAIAPHWCPCQIHRPVPVTDVVVGKAAYAVIQTVNNLTEPQRRLCATLSLDEVLDARVADSRFQANSSGHKRTLDYLIVVSASPSEALFEATVHCDARGDRCTSVTDEISRINEYGTQSQCVNDVVIKKFCFCNGFKF